MNWGIFYAIIATFCWIIAFVGASIAKKEKESGQFEEAKKTLKGGTVFMLMAMIFTAIAAGLLV